MNTPNFLLPCVAEDCISRSELVKTSCFTNTVNTPFTPWAGLLYLFQTSLRGRRGGGGALNRDGDLSKGGGGLLNLATMVVSVLHKDLECKVEKLKNKKLEVMQRRI